MEEVKKRILSDWSSQELDQEVVEGLKKSFRVIRPIYPIIINKNTNRVVDGRHRFEASPASYANYVVRIEMTEKEELLYTMHLNYRRTVHKEERIQQLTKLAEMLEHDGVTSEKMVQELARITPFSDQYIRELLPDKYKNVEMARSASESLKDNLLTAKPVSQTVAPPPEVKEYKPKDTWEYRESMMHPRESKMDLAVPIELQKLGIRCEMQKEVTVSIPDIYLPDVNLYVYLDGEKVHKDREVKDAEFRELLAQLCHIKIVSIPYKQFNESELKRIVDEIAKMVKK